MNFQIFLCFLFVFTFSSGQSERKIARDGNRLYSDSLYLDAEIQYLKSLSKDSSFTQARFNLGNALFKQGRYNESIGLFNSIIETADDSLMVSEAYYNIGNSYVGIGDNELQNAVSAYKSCLKINPSDEEARYNLSKALSRLNQNEKNENQNQNEKNENQKNQNSGKTDDLSQDDEDEKEKNQGDNSSNNQNSSDSDETKENENSVNSVQENQLSKKDIERILNALAREEEKLQEKMIKMNSSNKKTNKIDKDW